MSVRAYLWDFDGTLADTRHKNFNVTRRILAGLNPEAVRRAPLTEGPEGYDRAYRRLANWREFYTRHLGLDDNETDRAGRLWTRYQLEDETPVPLFDGVAETLRRLREHVHGVVSQNARTVIERTLADARLHGLFRSVVGYEEVPIRRQKPEPDGILLSLKQLRVDAGVVVFVGDHPTDVLTAHNANQALQRTGSKVRIVSVVAAYSCGDSWQDWPHLPDHVASHPRDIVAVQPEENSIFPEPD